MWRYRWFFAVIYFLQGAALCYVTTFQKPYLFGQGIGPEKLGLFTSSLLIPFILKVFLGALSDKGHSRKVIMLLGLAIFGLGFCGLIWVEPGQNFAGFWALMWIVALGMATFDVCADGWAVDIADEQEQGNIQASMVAGKSFGFVATSMLFGWLALRMGFQPVFLILTVLALIVGGLVVFVPHGQNAKPHHPIQWGDLKKRFYIFFGIYGILFSFASYGTNGLLTLRLSAEKGADTATVGQFGLARGLGALLGAWLFVLVLRKLGMHKTLALALVLLAAGCLIPLVDLPYWAAGVAWGVVWGLQDTAFVTVAMRFAEGKWAATFFAISMIFANLGTSFGEAIGGILVPKLGYDLVFVVFAVVAILSCSMIKPMLQPFQTEL